MPLPHLPDRTTPQVKEYLRYGHPWMAFMVSYKGVIYALVAGGISIAVKAIN